jgi:hypothetical protein
VNQCYKRFDYLNILVACDFNRKIQICENKDNYYTMTNNTIITSSCLNLIEMRLLLLFILFYVVII